MKRRNWMGFAKRQVERGKIHTSPGLLKRLAARAKLAAGEARAAKKRAKEKEDEAYAHFKELKDAHGKGYRWPSTKREKAGRSSGRDLSDLLYGRNPEMAKKRKRKKRKNAMPAGLKAYWAKKRGAKKNSRRKARRKPAKRAAVRNYRRRRAVMPKTARRRRRRQSNPLSRVRQITLPAMSPASTKKTIALIRRLTKRRVRVK